jgi:undecaprenyl-diphosphatase
MAPAMNKEEGVMDLWQIAVLAVIQGMCELLPVSSSAHVIMAEKLMGLDPTAPQMTLLLVMLHTGTMLAVIVYFWRAWRECYFASASVFWPFAGRVVVATLLTGIVGGGLILFIENVVLAGSGKEEIEHLFGNLYVIAVALATVGIVIILSGLRPPPREPRPLKARESAWIGAVQGICLPFRGFSRSGSTISTGLFLGLDRARVEEFSFALAVVLTPPAIAKEGWRLLKANPEAVTDGASLLNVFWPSLAGMFLSFLAGLVALRWLSRWLEIGRWHYFGYYCLIAGAVVLIYELAG